MCVWPHLVGDRTCFPWYLLSCPSPSHPPPKLLHPAGASWVYCLPTDGNLYAVGGYDSSSHLATVEKYEPQVHSAPLSQCPPLKCWVEWGIIPDSVPSKGSAFYIPPLTLRYPAKSRVGGEVPLVGLPSACPPVSTGEFMDTRGFHAEPAQLSRSSSTGGCPVRRRGQ